MKIKELLTDESKWTRGLNARTSDDQYAPVAGEQAAKWCINGAALRCYFYTPTDGPRSTEYPRIGKDIAAKLGLVGDDVGWHEITIWNDAPERNFSEVKALVEELDI